MLTLRLAFRNMLAHRQRNVTMFVSVGLVTFLAFLFMAFADGELENFRYGLLTLLNPVYDVRVNAEGFKRAADENESWKKLSQISFRDGSGVLAKLGEAPGVAAAARRNPSVGLSIITGGQRYSGFNIRNLDPQHDWQFTPYLAMKSGAYLDNSNEPELIMHYRAAANLKIAVGDTIRLTGRDLFGQAVSQDVVVKGFFAPNIDNPNLTNLMFINNEAYDLTSGFNPGEALGFALKLQPGLGHTEEIAKLTAWAKAQGIGMEFTDFDSEPRDDSDVYGLIRIIFQVVSALMVFVVSFGVMSLVSVNLYNRKREIGTYYCLGSERAFLMRLYTIEITLLNLLATAAGILIGLIFRFLINAIGITTDDAGMQLVFAGSRFRLGLNGESVLFIVALMLGVTLITTLTSIGGRLKVPPVAALRETD